MPDTNFFIQKGLQALLWVLPGLLLLLVVVLFASYADRRSPPKGRDDKPPQDRDMD